MHKGPVEIRVEREPGKEFEIEIKKPERMIGCSIPEFPETKRDTEKLAKQMEFLTGRIRFLDKKMVSSKKADEIANIRKEMHCRIEQLEEKTDMLEEKSGFARVGKMTV